ncbi:hypothetical protein G7067_12540 [Leucobacter insecticola]|uniref:Alpha/beta hydrolase n=1 Tax=Leucobacter insecticola TaxID=2714934 RepID=A0A6G8FKZ8_9MICO|nr:hypothetical protein [Leucobacter insecticola]QIM17045.1 hypothetical protein G7067_12540 [Leucobacter insecticola]
MNAMAFAPIKGDGTPDYSNVAVVFAGTNNVNLMGDTGKTGTGGAIRSMGGYLSPEYKPASAFLEKTLMSVESKPGGRVTDVGGFSQSGAYLMKMTAVYAPVHGFRSVSFDDFGGMQQRTLTTDELAWLKENPQAFLRYRNARSFAAYSLRDHMYGTIVSVSLKEHDTLARYFDGDALNLDRLAKDGHFVSGMSAEQVALAARTFLKDNPSWMSGSSEKERIAARIKE